MPHAVMTTTGSGLVGRADLRQQVEAFLARRRVAGVVEIDQHDVVLAAVERRVIRRPASRRCRVR